MRALRSLSLLSLSCVALASAGCCAHAPVTTAGPPPAVAAAPLAKGTGEGAAPARSAGPVGPARAEPATAEACRACGGEWARHGIASEPSCLCPTTDADKPCRDGSECQGQCLADAGQHQVTAAGPPTRGYFLGTCSRFRTTFGCHRIIAAGALATGPVLLDEPPTEMCAD